MTIWVIGADSGVGYDTARELERQGFDVYDTTRNQCDVRYGHMVRESARYLRDRVSGDGTTLEGVVYSAGINELAWLGTMGVSGMSGARSIFEVNALGFITVLDALGTAFKFGGPDDGHHDTRYPRHDMSIVAISSDAGTRPLRTSHAYCASKAALNSVVRSAARELGPFGVRVNAVAPGMIEGTEMSKQMDREIPLVRNWTSEDALDYERGQEVVPGRVPVSEVVKAIGWLLDPTTKHMNGEILTINGGR